METYKNVPNHQSDRYWTMFTNLAISGARPFKLPTMESELSRIQRLNDRCEQHDIWVCRKIGYAPSKIREHAETCWFIDEQILELNP